MVQSSNALAELLAGKTPEAMYDALYAGRYLSAKGQDAPAERPAPLRAAQGHRRFPSELVYESRPPFVLVPPDNLCESPLS